MADVLIERGEDKRGPSEDTGKAARLKLGAEFGAGWGHQKLEGAKKISQRGWKEPLPPV